MPTKEEKTAAASTISTCARSILGPDVHHCRQPSLHNNNDSDQDTDTIGGKRFGPAWLLAPLLFLLYTHSKNNVLVDDFLATTILGLCACASLFFLVYAGNAWTNIDRSRRKISFSTDPAASIFDLTSVLYFVRDHYISLFLLLVTAVARICSQFLLIRFRQCLIPGVEGLVPLAYVLWNSRWKHGVYHGGRAGQAFFGLPRQYRGPDAGNDRKVAILLAISVWIGSSMLTYPRSTVICERWLALRIVPVQGLVVLLDLCILLCGQYCLDAISEKGISPISGIPVLFGAVCSICTPFVLLFSLVFKLASNIHSFENLSWELFTALAWAVLLVFGILLAIGRSMTTGRLLACMTASSGVFVFISIYLAVSSRDELTSLDCIKAACAIAAVLYAAINDIRPRKEQSRTKQHAQQTTNYVVYIIVVLLACLAMFGVISEYIYSGTFQDHPIDNMIYAADQAHQAWALQAKQSQTLQEAVLNYQKRYNRPPPPNFHVWYNFAVARNSDVLDDFDNIERDLAPFRGMTPAELRRRAKEVTDDPFNDIGLIKIRNGTAEVDTRFAGHRWMMDVVVLMLEYFISSLPDMDIPFNINDESRVVASFDELQYFLANQPSAQPATRTGNWSTDTGALLDRPVHATGQSLFEEWSFRNNFRRYSTLACSPASTSRQSTSWLPNRHCSRCSLPHTVSQFVDDWNLAGDPCHQPDLATLHGFYQGPGSYKTANKLVPVFSASKPQGYSDILYPSIWQWDEGQRVAYTPNQNYPSPEYNNKSETLFWRGATSEGFTDFGQWRTFSRQRLVYMNTNSTQSLPVYLPRAKGSDEYNFEHLTREQFLNHPQIKESRLELDTRFTTYGKAWEDVMYEPEVFGTVEPVDFQAHWQHKYLMSLDEGSANKNFLPLLVSNSLPFRASIFREWFDDRIFAWKHFVPVDLRFQGLWSTLAYFAGGFGTVRSTEGLDAGEFIAQSGRLWGSRTLRKEDIEIYFFRLLLEWGRLLDDRRDEIGFQL